MIVRSRCDNAIVVSVESCCHLRCRHPPRRRASRRVPHGAMDMDGRDGAPVARPSASTSRRRVPDAALLAGAPVEQVTVAHDASCGAVRHAPIPSAGRARPTTARGKPGAVACGNPSARVPPRHGTGRRRPLEPRSRTAPSYAAEASCPTAACVRTFALAGRYVPLAKASPRAGRSSARPIRSVAVARARGPEREAGPHAGAFPAAAQAA